MFRVERRSTEAGQVLAGQGLGFPTKWKGQQRLQRRRVEGPNKIGLGRTILADISRYIHKYWPYASNFSPSDTPATAILRVTVVCDGRLYLRSGTCSEVLGHSLPRYIISLWEASTARPPITFTEAISISCDW